MCTGDDVIVPIDYKQIKRQAWIKNSNEVDTTNPEVMLKITNRAELMGVDPSELANAVNNDDYLRMMFAKDPSKQNIFETGALEFLCSIPGVKSVTKLPAAGPNAIYVDNHVLSLGETGKTTRKGTKSKSIDFKIELGILGKSKRDTTIYAMHKYTEHVGGAQDNQFQDIITFLENVPLKRVECFVALLDGNYYTPKMANMKKEYTVVGHRRVMTSNEFEIDVLNGVIFNENY